MKYDNNWHDICISDMVDIYVRDIKEDILKQKNIAVMSYDSSSIGSEFIELRQTIRTGGSFSPITPWEHDILTVIVNTELMKGAVVMHDPHYRHVIQDAVSKLNKKHDIDFSLVYERKLDSKLYFSKS